MSDISGTTPEEPIGPEEGGVPEEPLIPPAEAVIPPPPPDIPIPDGLLSPPPSAAIPPADAVLPPPPSETRRRSDRPRPTPAILDGEPPAAVADDWARPSVAPEAPTSGSYGGLTVAIFVFLFVLLIAAIGLVVFLLNTVSFPWAGADGGETLAVVLRI
ncbi:hypothetical protein [Microbacterium paraoxydans]|uniref:hypothetical protein n=1 Tax=Microbacterium paraoxydans TaxID=199592 RepID=UPI001CFA257C|nr:hypothetical protein [Microbacterium paraoxydans]